jgi:NAD-dependent SIR2 family protein deacetylase
MQLHSRLTCQICGEQLTQDDSTKSLGNGHLVHEVCYDMTEMDRCPGCDDFVDEKIIAFGRRWHVACWKQVQRELEM